MTMGNTGSVQAQKIPRVGDSDARGNSRTILSTPNRLFSMGTHSDWRSPTSTESSSMNSAQNPVEATKKTNSGTDVRNSMRSGAHQPTPARNARAVNAEATRARP